MDKKSLAHTTWKCKYYIVVAPECRRKIIYGASVLYIIMPQLIFMPRTELR